MAKKVTITLTLTEDEWCEMANALTSKAAQIERGLYGAEENPGDDETWMNTLKSAYVKLGVELAKNGVVY